MTFRQIVRKICKAHSLFLSLAVPLLTLSSFVEASAIFGLTPIIDFLIHPDLNQASGITIKIIDGIQYLGLPVSIVTVMLFFLCIIAVKNIVSAASTVVFTKLHFRLIRSLIVDEFAAFLSANWRFFLSNSYGVLGNTLVKETEKLGLSFEAVVRILSGLLRIIFFITLGLIISWELTVTVLTLLALFLVPFALLGNTTYKIGKLHTAAGNDFHGMILETFSAAKLILGFGNQRKSLERLANSISPYISTATQFVLIRALTPLAFEPIGIAIVLTAVYAGIYYYQLNVSEVVVLLFAFRMSCSIALDMTVEKNRLQNMAPALEQIYRLKSEAECMKERPGGRRFDLLQREIGLKNITFAYPSGECVLSNINLVIPKGKLIAIIGKSGSGKTTLIDLLMGFYKPQSGQFLVDDADFESLDITSWRNKIGYVPQDAFLFNMSVKDNLIWCCETASAEDIHSACRLANATEFIEKFPQGYDTILGDRGVRLSGGERQRIALARAILKRPEILILDEATSALDSHSEALVQNAIDSISKATTVIVVAHRLATIRQADYIYVLDHGVIVEEGTFEYLMAIKGGEFLKAAEMQGISLSPER